MPRKFLNNHGGALLGYIVLCLMLIGILLWHSQWVWVNSRASLRSTGTEMALQYADSGINATRSFLERPDWAALLPVGGSTTIKGVEPNGRFQTALYRNP